MRTARFVLLFAIATATAADLCDDSCLFSLDDECDDGGEGSTFFFCDPGTDCTDCNPFAEPTDSDVRTTNASDTSQPTATPTATPTAAPTAAPTATPTAVPTSKDDGPDTAVVAGLGTLAAVLVVAIVGVACYASRKARAETSRVVPGDQASGNVRFATLTRKEIIVVAR